jgi:hypothetical protein
MKDCPAKALPLTQYCYARTLSMLSWTITMSLFFFFFFLAVAVFSYVDALRRHSERSEPEVVQGLQVSGRSAGPESRTKTLSLSLSMFTTRR